jgi:thiol-disulfide isomerase/thioredoxin
MAQSVAKLAKRVYRAAPRWFPKGVLMLLMGIAALVAIVGLLAAVGALIGGPRWTMLRRQEGYSDAAPRPSVELFHATWCGHCVRFKPTWDAFAKRVREEKLEIDVADHEVDEDKAAFEKRKVSSFPTVLFIKPDGEATKYDGPRTEDGLMKAAVAFISS